eukprot:scaffold918_cov126-Cylindrotheca_fusiformis.AAC.72
MMSVIAPNIHLCLRDASPPFNGRWDCGVESSGMYLYSPVAHNTFQRSGSCRVKVFTFNACQRAGLTCENQVHTAVQKSCATSEFDYFPRLCGVW